MWRRAAAVTLLVLSALAVLPGCSSGSSDRAPTAAEAQDVLDAYAAALRAHDTGAALKLVASGPASSAFRQREQSAATGLARLPLATWSYRVGSPVTEQRALDTARSRYGRPSLLTQVQLSYSLAGIDDHPSEHDLWLSFVRQDGHTRIAGDDDLANSGGASWRGIWDYGDLVVAHGTHALVIGHVTRAARVADLAAEFDRAYPVIDAAWGTDWTRGVAVLVPDDADEFAALAGSQPSGGTAADVGAETIVDGDVVRIVFAPDSLGHGTAEQQTALVRHELTHVATRSATTATTPRWLVEGYAEYLAKGDAATTLTAVPPRLPTAADLQPSGKGAAAAYETSRMACRYLAEQIGANGLAALYRAAGSGDWAAALRTAGLTSARFDAGWRAFVRGEIR